LVGLGLAMFLFPPYYTGDCENHQQQPPFVEPFHSSILTKSASTQRFSSALIADLPNVIADDNVDLFFPSWTLMRRPEVTATVQ